MPFSWSWIILPLFPPQRQFGSILDYFLILGKPISQHAVIRTLTDCSFDCAVIHPLSIKNKFPLLGHWGGWLHPGLGVEPNPNGDPAEHKSLHLAEYLFCTNILNIVWFRGGKKKTYQIAGVLTIVSAVGICTPPACAAVTNTRVNGRESGHRLKRSSTAWLKYLGKTAIMCRY